MLYPIEPRAHIKENNTGNILKFQSKTRMFSKPALAERVGFEPTVQVNPVHSLSRRAPSATRPSLQQAKLPHAAEVGFEPTGLVVRRFSRPLPSSTRPLRHSKNQKAIESSIHHARNQPSTGPQGVHPQSDSLMTEAPSWRSVSSMRS